MRNIIERFISWYYIRAIWGNRCPDVEPECIVCAKWIEHDELFNSKGENK